MPGIPKFIVVIATDITLYLLTVLDALIAIQCITLVLFFSQISIGSIWGWTLHFFTFQETVGSHLNSFRSRQFVKLSFIFFHGKFGRAMSDFKHGHWWPGFIGPADKELRPISRSSPNLWTYLSSLQCCICWRVLLYFSVEFWRRDDLVTSFFARCYWFV